MCTSDPLHFFFFWSVSTCLWTIWNSEQKLPFLELEIFSYSYTHKLRQPGPGPQDVTGNISVSLNVKRQWHKYTLTKCSAGSQPTAWPSFLLLGFTASQEETGTLFPPQVLVIKTILKLCEILFGNTLCFVPCDADCCMQPDWLIWHLFIKGSTSPGLVFGFVFFSYHNIEEATEESENESLPQQRTELWLLKRLNQPAVCLGVKQGEASLFSQPVRIIHFLTQPTCDSHRWPPSLLSSDDFPFPLPKYNSCQKANVAQAGDIPVVQGKSSLSIDVILKPRTEILLLSSHSHTYINTLTQYKQVPETPKCFSPIRRHFKTN